MSTIFSVFCVIGNGFSVIGSKKKKLVSNQTTSLWLQEEDKITNTKETSK